MVSSKRTADGHPPPPAEATSDGLSDLERGRKRYRERAWVEAYDYLSRADRSAALGAPDLASLAWSAGLAGRDEDLLAAFARLYQTHLDVSDGVRAAYFAFWSGLRLGAMGNVTQAGGWFARAARLVEGESEPCVVEGYLLLPVVRRHVASGELEAAHEAAARAAAIGDRFKDVDLMAFARHLQGRVLLRQGRVEAGFALLDEALLAAVQDELSPTVTGLIFCSAIDTCKRVYALDRARAWTSALTEWCAAQPQLAAFTGACSVHRAEIMQVGGAWQKALEEAARACEPPPGGGAPEAGADAFYQQGEIHRLRGEFGAAEEAYGAASQLGREPQPGLSLLRLAQGRTDAAASAIRRVMGAATDKLERATLLPAFVEILLAEGDIEEARRASRDLEAIATAFDSDVLRAMAAHSEGLVHLAAGEPEAAMAPLRRAFRVWQQVGAPYAVARIRTALARTCHALGDADGARLELDAATVAFDRLGAATDLAIARTTNSGVADKAAKAGREQGARARHDLTPRELEVLRLVATGKTNKVIAKDLFLSEKTVDRHVSNIFAKTGVGSRAAATAYAYENGLV
jgi:DNA-binding CsgD family transcriptional regulator